MFNLLKWFYDFTYRFRKPPWDTGLTPPEVVSLVESGGIHGCALDLGCGTGTHSIYLAQRGFVVVGVDFSPKAIEMAREKARQAGAAVDFRVGDVTCLDFLREPFDFVLDIGCLHSLDAMGRTGYARHLARLTSPGGTFLLWAFDGRSHFGTGVAPEEVKRTFAPHFAADRVEHGISNRRASTRYWLRRQ
jgi:2-polyprenyl-3-methyl-5-hydroxy-6-metoxy-1,4-benzoquinol methylase